MEFNLSSINEDDDNFTPIINSLLSSTFLPDNDGKRVNNDRLVDRNFCLKMPTISNLYIYTNPPPVGYGSPGPKVAESISRAQKFNRKVSQKESKIGPFTVNRGFWEEADGDYPFSEITGNWHPGECYKMLLEMRERFASEIREVTELTSDYMFRQNANVLTSGRQTWNPMTFSSNPSPTAYLDMVEFLKSNNMDENLSLFTLSQSLHTFPKDVAIFPTFKRILHRSSHFNKKKQQHIRKESMKKLRRTMRIRERNKIETELLKMASSFCSYIKHGERGKLNRRAIASPNMFLRAYLNIIEYFHLELSKKLPGTTISIGGDEKKQKIIKEVSTAATRANQVIYTATQDATKFNECMNADLFALMHMVLFRHGEPNQNENERILCKLFTEGNFLLAIKRITLGQGPKCFDSSKTICNYLDYNEENFHRFNTFTKSWLTEIKDRITENYVEARPGMLMGMHNAAATTVSYLAAGYRQDEASVMYKTLRSSDDSLSVITAINAKSVLNAIRIEYNVLKMLGVNMATSKSYWIQGILGEYNSWYLDGGFSAQYGTETSAIRPQGISPGDDFNSCAMSTSSALAQHCINPLGAQMRLILGISHIRRVWRINHNLETSNQPYVFLGDGGTNPWTAMSCGLEETSLRYSRCDTEDKMNYWKKCLNPYNPFTREPGDEYHFNKEKGIMTKEIAEAPRTVFHYTQRHNRTFKGERMEKAKNNMKFATQALECLETANPALKIINYQSQEKCSSFIINKLDDLFKQSSSHLNEEDKILFYKAYDKIMNLNQEDEQYYEFPDSSDDDL